MNVRNRGISGVIVVACLFGPVAFAWNKPGHMVSAAIAYAELKEKNPDTITAIVALLQSLPESKSKWRGKLEDVAPEDRELFLFMLAARWADDIRGDRAYDRGDWHYINYPFKPKDEPNSVRTPTPPAANILQAYRTNLQFAKDDNATAEDRAIAIAWLFHLVGDAHQPLHSTSLFTTQYPEGDRGGTRFYIRVEEGRGTISLHKFWDGLIIGSERFQSVRNRATELRARPEFQRGALDELREHDMRHWLKEESFELAKSAAYRNGNLIGSTDSKNGAILPAGYTTESKALAERRVVLAGLRLADVLREVSD